MVPHDRGRDRSPLRRAGGRAEDGTTLEIAASMPKTTKSAMHQRLRPQVRAGRDRRKRRRFPEPPEQLVEAFPGRRRSDSGRSSSVTWTLNRPAIVSSPWGLLGLHEEPLKNAPCRRSQSQRTSRLPQVRQGDDARLGFWLSRSHAATARDLIRRYNVETPSTETRIRVLSAKRDAPFSRELSSNIDVLIVANPCFRLASPPSRTFDADHRQRDRGAASCSFRRISTKLELSDRSQSCPAARSLYLTEAAGADRTTIGRYMAGH